ncbi:MAG: hypothetical protein U1E78_02605 [Gammaproteobacteria bacterium]
MYDIKILKNSEETKEMTSEHERKLGIDISQDIENLVVVEGREAALVEFMIPESEVLIPNLTEPDHISSRASQAIKEVPNPVQAGVLPHYVSIDFQGCELNVNFYDSISKPISPHEIIKPELDHIHLEPQQPEEIKSTVPAANQGAQESELSPLPPNQGGDVPSPPDPIWFA